MGNDGNDMRVLKKKSATIAQQTRDRGLLIKGQLKNQKSSRNPGPGAYQTLDDRSILKDLQANMSRRSPIKMGSTLS